MRLSRTFAWTFNTKQINDNQESSKVASSPVKGNQWKIKKYKVLDYLYLGFLRAQAYPILNDDQNFYRPPFFSALYFLFKVRRARMIKNQTPREIRYICLETRLIDDIFAWKGGCLGNVERKWKKRSHEIAEFLTKTERKKCKNTQKILLVGSVLYTF